jgi:heat shock protein HslJ
MVSGAGGCNSYNATVTSDDGQLLTVGPIAATAMACDEELEAREADYLAALQGATGWRFFPGQLAVDYVMEDGEQGTLFFNPAGSPDAAMAP